MRPRLRLTFVIMVGGAVGVNGCSYTYEVEARVIDGRLAFLSPAGGDQCMSSVSVTTEQKIPPIASTGPGPISNASELWSVNYPMSCGITFPILYGGSSAGAKELVRARPLRIGIVYEISTRGDGGYGSGRFRITPQRRVENLPHGSGV